MCKACGYAADALLRSGYKLSTDIHSQHAGLAWLMDIHRLISNLSITNPHHYPQSKPHTSPLFEKVFYPVSTAPIITTTN